MWQLPSVFDGSAQFSPCEPPPPSSKVTKIAVLPELYAWLFTSMGNHVFNQSSPVCTLQLCMSLQRLGVTNAKFGSVLCARSLDRMPADWSPIGTSFAGQVDFTSV